MANRFVDFIEHARDIFRTKDRYRPDIGTSYGYRPDRMRINIANERSIIASVYTRLAVDISAAEFRHVRQRKDGLYLESIPSGLHECLNVEANLDQSGEHLIRDISLTLFNEGVAAVVPTEWTERPNGTKEIKTLRAGPILDWRPDQVRVKLYNERTGNHEEVWALKRDTAIIENPFYSIMNEPNSTLQRLIRKLNILDSIDEATGSGKLDIIIQLPYVIRSESRKKQAEQRRKDIEAQLTGSKYGIAYTDGTERVTQLNRPAENNLLTQITTLKAELYEQLGLSAEIFNGSAEEGVMLNYYSRSVGPILDAIAKEMRRKFLTKTARSQGQTIMYFRDPFKLVSVNDLAEISDKFTRNEIASSNEIRGIMGWRPSDDPKADQLVNSNLNQASDEERPPAVKPEDSDSPTNN